MSSTKRTLEASNDETVSKLTRTEETPTPIIKPPPAKVYPFKLDTFQQEAVNYIENNESVLVAAHTSAGKTAVAEYAIAKSLRDGQRVIYTSPIKALSNQKFRDLQEEFKDVGLMTGDMTINAGATCLIMTTEILRSMLYKGSEVMREVAWVIYDEVHYMRDKERGVVWEESIILLPHKVRFVFLSATIPNAKEFVGWVSKLHNQPCHVVYTDYRPVPLQHFVFPAGAEGLYLVVDDKGKFKEDNFQKAMVALQGPSELDDKTIGKNMKNKKKLTNSTQTDLVRIVRLIMDRGLDPVIVFSFSKRDCETYAMLMAKFDFNQDEEKDLIEQVFFNAIDALSEDDQNLPQITTILPLLKRGIGIHHGGLLPIVKEVIEILFQEGLIKCLFATETFSIGINMPAKTVIFTSTRKFDGQEFRWITSGEYIQMSGRAGRRGKDDRGNVIQMLDEKMDPTIAKDMIYGASDPLFSSYKVGYNMVLNMLRVEDADPENVLRCSFQQYQQEQAAPQLIEKAEMILYDANQIQLLDIDIDETIVNEYYTYTKQLHEAQLKLYQEVMKPTNCLPFLNTGRLMHIHAYGIDWGWGMLVNHRKAAGSEISGFCIGFDNNRISSQDNYILDILMYIMKGNTSNEDTNNNKNTSSSSALSSIDLPIYQPCTYDDKRGQMEVIRVSLRAIYNMSQVRLTVPKDLTRESTKKNIQNTIKEVFRRYTDSGGVPVLHPIDDIGIRDPQLVQTYTQINELKTVISKNSLTTHPNKQNIITKYTEKMEMIEEAKLLQKQANETQTVVMKEELKKMKKILKKLDFITNDGVLTIKGRFSCELSIADELVLTEMIFDGFFNELNVIQITALMSAFVHKEGVKESGPPNIRNEMQQAFTKLLTIARYVAEITIQIGMTCEIEEYLASFNPDMIDVTYAWANGAKISEICKLTDIFEGSIIRVLRRLEELMRQMGSAALAIGNIDLKTKFEAGADSIRRGVVFAASLYT